MSIAINTNAPNNILAINCGTSTPRLSGSVDITSFPNLTSFICLENDITAFSALDPMPSLLVLLLSSNKLTGTFYLSGFSNLQNLDLRDNRFSNIQTAVMPTVLALNLDSNPLSGTFNLDSYPNIVSLDLSNTSVSALNTSTGSLTSLQNLVARYADFTGTFDATIFPNLTSLDLLWNGLTAVPTFSVGNKIETLNLYYNPIVGILI
jgi:Leucine-rich repeat (LRR) protein